MKAGEIVRIRLSTADCMAIADIIQIMKLHPGNLSLSGAASIAMSAAFEELRIAGRIPYRQGFEYLTMVAPFQDKGNMKMKRLMTEEVQSDAMRGRVPSLNGMVYVEGAGPEVVESTKLILPDRPEGFTDAEWESLKLQYQD